MVEGTNLRQQDTLTKLINAEPFLLNGVENLVNDRLVFDALNRAATALANAKNSDNLQAAEAGFQTTINEIRQINQTKNSYISNDKAAQYIFTLQNSIFCLSDWKFANGKENNYVPLLTRKMNQMLMQATEMGLDPAAIRDYCYSDAYQSKTRPELADFQFLDDQKMDAVLNDFRQYQLTKDNSILTNLSARIQSETATNNLDCGVVTCKPADTATLDKLIGVMTAKYSPEKMQLAYIKNHLNEFFEMVGETTNHQDQECMRAFATAIVKRVVQKSQEMQQVQNATTAREVL